MKNQRALDFAYCICFAAILVVPLFFFNVRGTVSSENRALASFPPLPHSLSQAPDFTNGVEAWLNDRIGFRKKMLTLYRCIELYGFGVSPSDIVALGRRDTAFLLRAAHSKVKNEEILEALGEDGARKSLQATQLDILRGNAASLAKSPRRVVVLAVPTAPLFRFDDLPQHIRMEVAPKTPDNHPVGLALAAFATEDECAARNFLFPFHEGEEIAKRYAPYPEKNFHWSWSPFTMMVSELVTERLGHPVSRRWTQDDFQPCTTSSDLAHLVGAPFKNKNDVCPSRTFHDGVRLTTLPIAEALPGPDVTKTVSGTYYRNESLTSGRLLVVGDSFNYSLGLPLVRNFREVVVLDYYGVMRETHDRPVAIFRHIMEAYRPESVVIVRHNLFPAIFAMPGMETFLN